MKKIEMHAKTKYSGDMDSTIDIETLLWNVKENGEEGIIFVDKDSVFSFPKIEKIYNQLCLEDKSMKNFKIGYGVQLSVLIDDKLEEIVLLVKKQSGLKSLYKLISMYLNEFNKAIPIDVLISLREGLLIGLMINNDNLNINLSLFDYLEINDSKYISKIDRRFRNKIVYSNRPNSLFEGERNAKEILYFYKKINGDLDCRLYLDTEDTLKECNDKEIVIDNSNNIFNSLEQITINDENFYINNITNFDEFEYLVRRNFSKKYKNPSLKTIERLNNELFLVKDMNYAYYFYLLRDIVTFCNDNNEYYQIDGYVNNTLIAYVLGITEIEPCYLPYELFFSEVPKLEFKVSSKFYYKKMFNFFISTFGNNLIKCNYGFKLSKNSISRIIRQYELKNELELHSSDKDYISNVLEGTSVYKENLSHSFYIIPDDKDILDFCPYEYMGENFKGTHFDYHDLSNNLINVKFILDEDIGHITNLINKTNIKPEFCNDKRVFNLFRNTEEFNCKFKILDKINGTLNIRDFEYKELESKLKNISNIWIDDLVDVLLKNSRGLIKDELYFNLKKRGFDDVQIFNVINYLKDSKKLMISHSFLLNKIRIAYLQMYYKLYYPKEYYEDILSDLENRFVDDKVYKYSNIDIKNRYYELNEKRKLYLSLEENEELEILEVLLEMYERNINYCIKDKNIYVGIENE